MQNFITTVLGKDGDQFMRLIRSPGGNGFLKDAQISGSIVPVGLEWQAFVDQENAARVFDPRQIAQTFFEGIPVPAEVAGKVQPAREDRQQITLAQQARWDANGSRVRGINACEVLDKQIAGRS